MRWDKARQGQARRGQARPDECEGRKEKKEEEGSCK